LGGIGAAYLLSVRSTKRHISWVQTAHLVGTICRTKCRILINNNYLRT